ncbi:MAG TPA: hypothetical protein VGV92_04015 [Gammaproteobacteria bacterium]|nr:hypothetical protein [Gammaproteobacteria bacterium]
MHTPGNVLVFSAGSKELNPDKHRVLHPSDDSFMTYAKHFPMLYKFVSLFKPIMLISCYPSTIGIFPHVIFTDTYLRFPNFARALMLAQKKGYTAVIVGQPLVVLDMLVQYKKQAHPFPRHLIIGIGGYYCPISLEKTLNTIVGNKHKISCVLHGYGTGESEFNSLVGIRHATQDIIYKPISNRLQPVIKEGKLWLQNKTKKLDYETGDHATLTSDGRIIIQNPPERLSPDIPDFLNQWTESDWLRRTGFITKQQDNFIMQLRQGVQPESNNNITELDFYAYANQFPFSWLDKPSWGATTSRTP